MFAAPNPTPYDLNFRLFGFSVRIHPLFWLGAVLLGGSTLQAGIEYLAIWVVVVFVSILVHELGHSIAYKVFGAQSSIILWVLGGLAVPYTGIAGRWQRIIVSLAGPLAGFLLAGAAYAILRFADPALRGGPLVGTLFLFLYFVNLYWNIINLLPVYPLDGGQVCKELCDAKWRGRGFAVALKISMVTSILVAAYSVLCEIERRSGEGPILSHLPGWVPQGSIYTAILFGFLAAGSYQMLQQLRGAGGYYYEAPDDRVSWEK